MLCEFCDGLSVSILIDLAKVEFTGHEFPQQAYYQHQPSYTHLARSAQGGCQLCEFIHRGCLELIISDYDTLEWQGMTRTQAALQIKSEGESSDIKVCINSKHLWSSSPDLAQVELFDVLLAQIGTPKGRTEDAYLNEREAIPPLELALSVPREEPRRLGKYRVGRFQLDPALGSQQNFSIAKRWLDDCCTSHTTCPSNHLSKLPTRVIDVGISNPRLVLCEEIGARYAALSHCWGGKISTLLTTYNLKSFQEALPLSDIPANFHDAISITRHLGIRYLWIDSLCIIQNSKDDWEVESKKMGSVYGDALVTISAATSHGSKDGILGCFPSSEEIGGVTSLKMSPDSSPDDTVRLSLKREGVEEEDLGWLFIRSPLFRRGWALQEEVLSPRVLYYGKRQVYWKCRQGFQSADGVPPGPLLPGDENKLPETSKILHSHSLNALSAIKPDLDIILEEYYDLVTRYSKRQLSFDSDKFPAFSGLAALIHPIVGGEYLAGIWSEDFRRGLCWYKEMGECRHTLLDQAPSWSWAVTNDLVSFEYTSNRKAESSPYRAQLLSHKVELKSQNIYGPVSLGRLVIEGLTKRLVRSSQITNSPGDSGARIYFDEGEIGRSSNVFEFSSEWGNYFLTLQGSREVVRKQIEMKDVDLDLVSEHDYLVLVLDSIKQSSEVGEYEIVTCLVLRRMAEIDEGESYCRVGALMSTLLYGNDVETWLQDWETKNHHSRMKHFIIVYPFYYRF